MDYKFKVRIYYEDTDAAQVVFYANYRANNLRLFLALVKEIGQKKSHCNFCFRIIFAVDVYPRNFGGNSAQFEQLVWLRIVKNNNEKFGQ